MKYLLAFSLSLLVEFAVTGYVVSSARSWIGPAVFCSVASSGLRYILTLLAYGDFSILPLALAGEGLGTLVALLCLQKKDSGNSTSSVGPPSGPTNTTP